MRRSQAAIRLAIDGSIPLCKMPLGSRLSDKKLAMRSVTITLAGQRLSLKTDADDRYVEQLVEMVQSRIGDPKRSTRGLASAALLAALQLADELLRERQDRMELRQKVREKSRSILEYIRREVKL